MQNEECRMKNEECGKQNEKIFCILHSAFICPVCDQRFDENDDGVAMPFCSSRCKLIDAARWLDERYGMPIEKPLGMVNEIKPIPYNAIEIIFPL